MGYQQLSLRSARGRYPVVVIILQAGLGATLPLQQRQCIVGSRFRRTIPGAAYRFAGGWHVPGTQCHTATTAADAHVIAAQSPTVSEHHRQRPARRCAAVEDQIGAVVLDHHPSLGRPWLGTKLFPCPVGRVGKVVGIVRRTLPETGERRTGKPIVRRARINKSGAHGARDREVFSPCGWPAAMAATGIARGRPPPD